MNVVPRVDQLTDFENALEPLALLVSLKCTRMKYTWISHLFSKRSLDTDLIG